MRHRRPPAPIAHPANRGHLRLLPAPGTPHPRPTASPALFRGVHIVPWTGPVGELLLVAITSAGRALQGTPVAVPVGGDRLAALDALWDRLDREDPDQVAAGHGRRA